MSNRRRWASKLNLTPAHQRSGKPAQQVTPEEYAAIRAAQEAARLERARQADAAYRARMAKYGKGN